MSKAMKRIALVSVSAALAAGAALAGSGIPSDRGSDHEIMAPKRGLSLAIGGKHTVSYFETLNNACHLTVMFADTEGDALVVGPGTRIVVPVSQGSGFKLDTASGASAEFFCGPGAERMSARVYDRAPYKS